MTRTLMILTDPRSRPTAIATATVMGEVVLDRAPGGAEDQAGVVARN